jgi:hypothetical protein
MAVAVTDRLLAALIAATAEKLADLGERVFMSA